MSSRAVRFLVKPEAQAMHLEEAVRCGGCAHAGDKKPMQQIAWCRLHRFMTGTTTPVLCAGFKAA